jgi:hypothetical protein
VPLAGWLCRGLHATLGEIKTLRVRQRMPLLQLANTLGWAARDFSTLEEILERVRITERRRALRTQRLGEPLPVGGQCP